MTHSTAPEENDDVFLITNGRTAVQGLSSKDAASKASCNDLVPAWLACIGGCMMPADGH
jgi:hypothetical protein